MNEEQLKRLQAVWRRVEASRPKLEGSAPLMPRKKKRPAIRIAPVPPTPKNYKPKTTF